MFHLNFTFASLPLLVDEEKDNEPEEGVYVRNASSACAVLIVARTDIQPKISAKIKLLILIGYSRFQW